VRVLEGLNKAEAADHLGRGFTRSAPDQWCAIEGRKYVALNCGRSGAFLVDKETGELFNIKGYGRADMNKKRKADLGDIRTVDPEVLHGKRFNYLR
jgi:hypothetical protein